MINDFEAMSRALAEGRKGLGFVSPNPAVGCVIVGADGNLLSMGFHHKVGSDHAEVDALKKILDPHQIIEIQKYQKSDLVLLRGATVYVTLEPCAHEGRTPSCAKTLASLPIRRLVFGSVDPNPLTAGKGRKILEQAGIRVESWSELCEADANLKRLTPEIDELAEHFLWFHQKQIPFISLKVATSLDGIIAHTSGESKWITGDESRRHVHALRAVHDAVLVGKNTFLLDDPNLNVRHPDYPDHKNRVVILDTKGELISRLPDSNLMKCHQPEDVFIVVGEKSLMATEPNSQNLGVHLVRVPELDGKLDLKIAIRELGKLGIQSILVEGGAQTISGFLELSLAQRFYQYIAPQIVGGKSGVSFSRDFGIADWRERLHLENPRSTLLGNDLLVTGRLPTRLAI